MLCWTAPTRCGIRTAFVAGDEVYGGVELRRGIRARGSGYVMAVRSNHMVTAALGPPDDREDSRRADQTRCLAADAHRVGTKGSQGTTTGR